MRDRDVHPDEMHDDLDALLDELRAAASATPPPIPGPALTTLFRDGAAPVAVPAPWHHRRRWRVAVAAAVAGFGIGGLGVAGALPGPVQERVADVAERLGVDLPDGRPDPTTTTSTTTTTASTSTSTSTSTTAPGKSGEHRRDDEAPGRVDETPGRSGEAPGRTTSEVHRQDDRATRAHGDPDVPAAAEARRNPAATSDVDTPDGPERRRSDDDGGSAK